MVQETSLSRTITIAIHSLPLLFLLVALPWAYNLPGFGALLYVFLVQIFGLLLFTLTLWFGFSKVRSDVVNRYLFSLNLALFGVTSMLILPNISFLLSPIFAILLFIFLFPLFLFPLLFTFLVYFLRKPDRSVIIKLFARFFIVLLALNFLLSALFFIEDQLLLHNLGVFIIGLLGGFGLGSTLSLFYPNSDSNFRSCLGIIAVAGGLLMFLVYQLDVGLISDWFEGNAMGSLVWYVFIFPVYVFVHDYLEKNKQ